MTPNTTNSYTIAVNLYGQRPAEPAEEDVPCHVGLAIYETSPENSLPSTCMLHQIRAPVGYVYAYEYRPHQPLATDPILNTSCILRCDVTRMEARRAVRVVRAFGNDRSNLPEWAAGNCQDWLAGAVEVLERAGIVREEDGNFWRGAVGKGRAQMEDDWKAGGRQAYGGPAKSFVKGSVEADARWTDKEERQVGKLAIPMDVRALLDQRLQQQS